MKKAESKKFKDFMSTIPSGDNKVAPELKNEPIQTKNKNLVVKGDFNEIKPLKKKKPNAKDLKYAAKALEKVGKDEAQYKKEKNDLNERWKSRLAENNEEARAIVKTWGHSYTDPDKNYPVPEISLVVGVYKGAFTVSDNNKNADTQLNEEMICAWGDKEYPELRGRELVNLQQIKKNLLSSTDPVDKHLINAIELLMERIPAMEEKTGAELLVKENSFNDALYDELKAQGKVPKELIAVAEIPPEPEYEYSFSIKTLKEYEGERCDGCGEKKKKVDQENKDFVCKRCGHK